MSDIIKIENIESLILNIRGQRVLLDADIAVIYGVETKRVNEAVKINADKFPPGYIVALPHEELAGLRSKYSTANLAKTRVPPQGLYRKRPLHAVNHPEKPAGPYTKG